MKTVILGNGLIGKAIARKLVAEKHDVIIASRAAVEKIDAVSYVESSFEDIVCNTSLFANTDFVIQTISTSSPSSSMQDIYKDASENILLNVKLLELLRRHPVKKFVFFSSGGSVYGKQLGSEINEEHATNPISAYGVAKISVEKYLHLYNYHYGLNYLTLRPSNVYGFIRNLKNPQGVISHLLDCAFNEKQFKLWGSLENRKDYLYVDDLAEAVTIALQYEGHYSSHVYNLSGGITASLGEIIKLVENITGKKIDIEEQVAAKFDVSSIEVDGSLFRKDFNWSPSYDIEAGIRKIVSQY